MNKHNCRDLITLFDNLFKQSENTILLGDADEPLYLPADANSPFHRVIFTRDYFASALHEIAHWCLASAERRKQVDYGYWYFPEGRTQEQQRLFEQAEVKPQALEMIFSQAARSRFIPSQDNLATGWGDAAAFEKNIAAQANIYLTQDMPERAALFKQALEHFYLPR